MRELGMFPDIHHVAYTVMTPHTGEVKTKEVEGDSEVGNVIGLFKAAGIDVITSTEVSSLSCTRCPQVSDLTSSILVLVGRPTGTRALFALAHTVSHTSPTVPLQIRDHSTLIIEFR